MGEGPWKRLRAGLAVQPGVPLNRSKEVFQRWRERVLPLIKVNTRKTDPVGQLACSGAEVFYCKAVCIFLLGLDTPALAFPLLLKGSLGLVLGFKKSSTET